MSVIGLVYTTLDVNLHETKIAPKMKKLAPVLLLVIALSISGCSKDDGDPAKPDALESFNFSLNPVNNSGVSGTVTISEKANGNATVGIKLNGSTTRVHPAFIYYGNDTQDTEIALTLNECECETSITEVTQLDNGTKITYQGLKAFNGHVKIHLSPEDLETVVAKGNIGVNAN